LAAVIDNSSLLAMIATVSCRCYFSFAFGTMDNVLH
jgi:hypothetical protein